MAQVNFEILKADAGFHLYLPFWKIKSRVKGLKLDCYGDLAKLANVPWAPQISWKERPVFFWVPAFRLPPTLFMKFSRRMTIMQPEREKARGLSDVNLHPPSLSIHAVTAWLKVALFEMAAAKRKIFPHLDQIEVQNQSFLLVYVPFRKYGRELVEPSAKLRVGQNALNR